MTRFRIIISARRGGNARPIGPGNIGRVTANRPAARLVLPPSAEDATRRSYKGSSSQVIRKMWREGLLRVFLETKIKHVTRV